MTFNSWLSNDDWQQVVKEVKRQNPDIVALIEFGSEKRQLLKKLKASYPYQTDCLVSRNCHMAVLSKFKFHDSKARMRWRGPPFLQVSFGGKLAGLQLFAVHTIRPPHYRAHFKQISALARTVNEAKGLKIVMGDFNSTPFSYTLKSFENETGLKRLTNTPSWPATYGQLPQVSIDHIFVSKKIRVLQEHYLGNSSGSDHFPVNVVVAVPSR